MEPETKLLLDRVRTHKNWNVLRTASIRSVFGANYLALLRSRFPPKDTATVGQLVDHLLSNAAADASRDTLSPHRYKQAVASIVQTLHDELHRASSIPDTTSEASSEASSRDAAIRALHRLKENPFISDRISDPFSVGAAFLDLEEVNEEAFVAISREIELVTSMGQCRGILVLGEAGTGKTHLLARIRSKLAEKVRMLFVPRPTNAESVMSSTWTTALPAHVDPMLRR